MDEDDLPYCIQTHYQARAPEADDAQVRRVVLAVLRAEACAGAEISVALMDGASVRELNARYLDRDEETDVLSFDLTDDLDDVQAAHGDARIRGQVVVNLDLARRRAGERRIEPAAEIMLYVVHGCLHLLGYDDTEPDRAAAMHRREDELLEGLGYGRAYGGADRSERRT